jgi:hypothetical protein
MLHVLLHYHSHHHHNHHHHCISNRSLHCGFKQRLWLHPYRALLWAHCLQWQLCEFFLQWYYHYHYDKQCIFLIFILHPSADVWMLYCCHHHYHDHHVCHPHHHHHICHQVLQELWLKFQLLLIMMTIFLIPIRVLFSSGATHWNQCLRTLFM